MDRFSVAILTTFFLYLLWVVWVCLYIKRTHPTVWAEMDEPSPLNYLLRHFLGLSRFVWRDYRRVRDARLHLYVGIGRGLAVVFVVLLIAKILFP